MKKIIITILVLGFVSCTNEDLELNDDLTNLEVSSFDQQKCDCGIGDLGGGGSNDETDNSNSHIFESYDYFGDVTVSGYNNPAVHIRNKSLVKFSYGINLDENGKIVNSAIGNVTPKIDVRIIHYDSNNEFYTFFLRVKGETYALVNGEWKRVATYVNVNLSIPTSSLPSYSGGGTGGIGVFPYNQ